jgi:K(+)-stimulated pyrophosphate-energized sodium pump
MLRHNLAAGGGAVVAGGNLTLVVIVAVIALLALAVAGWLVREVLAASQGTEKMQEIAHAVQEGAAAYLRRQFKTLGVFVVIIFFVLLLLPADSAEVRWGRSAFFLVGAFFSALTGFTGMTLTTRGNVRVAAAARETDGRRQAMKIAFRTGGVAGMFTVGLGLFGAAVVVLIFKANAPSVLEGFAFGAALLAMFMRVGGGIFTKAADVGADLVGKVEKGIPEDDPRNAATIADNVGLAHSGQGRVRQLRSGLPADRPDDRRRHRGDRHLRGRPAQERPQRHERHQPRLLRLRGRLPAAGHRRHVPLPAGQVQ